MAVSNRRLTAYLGGSGGDLAPACGLEPSKTGEKPYPEKHGAERNRTAHEIGKGRNVAITPLPSIGLLFQLLEMCRFGPSWNRQRWGKLGEVDAFHCGFVFLHRGRAAQNGGEHNNWG